MGNNCCTKDSGREDLNNSSSNDIESQVND